MTPLNGLWVASQRLCSASHWYIGKWWTQTYERTVAVDERRCARRARTRSAPSASWATDVAIGHDEHEVARPAARGGGEAAGRAPSPTTLTMEPLTLALAVEREPDEPPGTGPSCQLGQLVELLATEARPGPATARPTTRPPLGQDGLEDAEARCPRRQRTEVVELHAEAQVGLVRAEPVDRLAVREAREGSARMGRSGTTARVTADGHRSTQAITSSSATKLISRSSWVNSGCRSPRRSSSRRQRAIWK